MISFMPTALVKKQIGIKLLFENFRNISTEINMFSFQGFLEHVG